MPLARISVPSSLPAQRISALADAVHAGLVATCNVPDKDRFQLISVFPTGMMIIDPTFPDVRRTADASIVEILFLEGRTVEQKRRLFADDCRSLRSMPDFKATTSPLSSPKTP